MCLPPSKIFKRRSALRPLNLTSVLKVVIRHNGNGKQKQKTKVSAAADRPARRKGSSHA